METLIGDLNEVKCKELFSQSQITTSEEGFHVFEGCSSEDTLAVWAFRTTPAIVYFTIYFEQKRCKGYHCKSARVYF